MKNILSTKRLIPFLVAAVLVMTVVLIQTHRSSSATFGPTIRTINVTSHSIPSLPDGFRLPNELAADPLRDGVWMWSDNAHEANAFFVRAGTTTLKNYPLGIADSLVAAGIVSGLAVDPAGIVWVGAERTLIRLDPLTGAVARWSVPAPQIPSIVNGPPETRGAWEIRSLAVDSQGHVAIAFTQASSIAMFDAASSSFSSRSLPDGSTATQLAYAQDGTLGVGLVPSAQLPERIAMFTNDGGVRTVKADSYSLVAASNQFISISDNLFITAVANGATSSFALPTSLIPTLGGPVVVLGDGRIAASYHDGVFIVNRAKNTITKLPFIFPCPTGIDIPIPPSGSHTNVTSSPTAATCMSAAKSLVLDTAGDLWIINRANGELRMMDAGTF